METIDQRLDVSIALQSPKHTSQASLVKIEIEKTGKNSRRIQSKIGIDASFETIWKILTDYEKLVDFVPGLLVSRLLEKRGNISRIFQVGHQKLPFGLNFNAKATVDCFEKDVEPLPGGRKRDLEFKMAEGDFQIYEGRLSVIQVKEEKLTGGGFNEDQDAQTVLSFTVDAEPKKWLPIKLIEGRLQKEIEKNLICVQDEAKRVSRDAPSNG